MTTLRTAAQQALEALEGGGDSWRLIGPAITALKAALEQYDKDRVWIEERKANWALQRKLVAETPERDRQQREYEESRSAALEQPEPVAWRTFDGEGGYDYRTYDDNENYRDEWDKRNPNHKGWVEPLYTHPPRREWRGLSEEEINEATFHPDGRMNTHLEFARAVEAALKEKNT
jgi:hypothetical protein